MGLRQVNAGNDVPNDINVVIEIPAHSGPVKYEVDKLTGVMFVDRLMATAMHYPCDYGYVPNTLSEDGDPIDVLVISPVPLYRGTVLRCRPVGMLKMVDESGIDVKILAVPIDKITMMYHKIHAYTDLPELTLKQIAHFFQHYKDLEVGKWVKLEGWVDVDAAKQEIVNSVARYHAHST